MLELQHISWTAPGGSQVVRDVSFSVPEGKLTVITGPNGGGKTTLAKLIAGIETPDSGKILLDGQDITDLDVTQRARLGSASPSSSLCGSRALPCADLLELAAGEASAGGRASAKCWAGWGCAAGNTSTGRWTPPFPAGRSSASKSPRCWPATPSSPCSTSPRPASICGALPNLIDVFQSLRGKLNGTLLIISHQERILQIADEIVVISGGQLQEKGPAGEHFAQAAWRAAPPAGRCVKREAVFS